MDHPAEQCERLGGVAGHDRVGEVPRRHSPGFTEERFDLRHRDLRVGTVRTGKCGQDAVKSTGVLTEPQRKLVGRGAVDLETRLLDLILHPGPLVTPGRGVVDLALCLCSVTEFLGNPPTTGDEYDVGRIERIVDVGKERRHLVG